VPDESILFHGEKNHFSNWLKARTEFWLAHELRPRKVSDYKSTAELRNDLINTLHNYRLSRHQGIISDFNKEAFNPESSFARIGGGSLGGKARGLGFVNTLINSYNIKKKFENINIYVPPGIVIGTDVFDYFMEENKLKTFAIDCENDREIVRRFLNAKHFPDDIIKELISYLEIVNTPLAVRSSSLLEDSQYHPFAGVYETYMIPNSDEDVIDRLNELLSTVKKVYASTFFNSAKDYIKLTNYRLEEEKMAVVIQKTVGLKHENRFYPDIAGVAKSYNFYPMGPQKSNDGIASVALGLGKTVVDGGSTIRFCPKYPANLIQFYSVKDTMENSQKEFYALDLDGKNYGNLDKSDSMILKHTLDVAEKDDTLSLIGSTYSHENYAIYDGLSRIGPRVVTFGPLLKNKMFPLPEILDLLLTLGTKGMGTPIEIEFAVNIKDNNNTGEFGLLQMRPLVINLEESDVDVENFKIKDVICKSSQVLGNGIIRDVRDIVFVDNRKFDRLKTRDIAKEINNFNLKLFEQKKPYLLIGLGRWGTIDPFLGIPVTWDKIAGAKTIIEANIKDMSVEPSQGSHFFQNITSFMIGYFTVNDSEEDDYINWQWLLKQKPFEEKIYTKHLQFKNPITIKMNGNSHKGIILKPFP
jgi:hypothetical protein